MVALLNSKGNNSHQTEKQDQKVMYVGIKGLGIKIRALGHRNTWFLSSTEKVWK